LPPDTAPARDTGPIDGSASAVHDEIQRQIADLLAEADISEEERQRILVALACPCCGAGGVSLSVKLKPRGAKPE